MSSESSTGAGMVRAKRRSGSNSWSSSHMVIARLVFLASVCSSGAAAFSFCPPSARAKPEARPSALEVASRPRPRSAFHRRRGTSSAGIVGSPLRSAASANADSPGNRPRSSLRSALRAATGFSLTAFRTTLRAATGISLSEKISGPMRSALGVMTPGMRYFLQPFLIMYYAPMLVVRYWVVGPSREYVEEGRRGHERAVEGWRRAVEAAERANPYWPVHLNEDGTITTSLPPNPDDVPDLAEGIERSVAAATAPTSAK